MSASGHNPLPPIAVLCGGLATRLRPTTESIPKSMLEIAGQPFIAHQLRLFARAGLRRVVLLCGHLGEQIRDYVRSGARFGCSVEYSFDGPSLLGTGGAVRRALPLLGDEFLLVYGDSYLPTNYRSVYEAFRSSGLGALMSVYHNRNQWDRSNVRFQDGRILCYDKAGSDSRLEYIDYGLNAFRADIFAAFEEGKRFDLDALQKDLARRGELAGVEVSERFYEIGSREGIAATNVFLRSHEFGGNQREREKAGQ